LIFDGYLSFMVPVSQSPLPAIDKQFHFVGADLSLDFCNTVGGKRGTIPRENLHSYAHFLAWCQQAKLVDSGQRSLLLKKSEQDPIGAREVLARVIELREALYRIFLATASGAHVENADLVLLNAELACAMSQLRLGRKGKDFKWQWAAQPLALAMPLGPIAHSAATLLSSEFFRNQVHQCCGDNCGWLFLDCSKNHSRRWCDMRDCGNRAKVRRHRQKRGSGSAESST
jgi:predicted RNA-binding Zn ribbon-like protein